MYTCTHISSGALLTELFNFYYTSRAPAIKIILFWKFCLKFSEKIRKYSQHFLTYWVCLQHHKNPWHHGYRCSVALGLKISTHTHVTHDCNTMVLPTTMLHPKSYQCLIIPVSPANLPEQKYPQLCIYILIGISGSPSSLTHQTAYNGFIKHLGGYVISFSLWSPWFDCQRSRTF